MLKTALENQTLTIFLGGEIDHHCAQKLREEIDQTVEQEQPHRLILDFKGVTFMDSSGIGLVMGRYKLMHAMQGELLVVNLNAHISKIMKLAGLDQLAVIKR